MPRLLSRTLLVLGGTVAATAAAWLISSASASAGTLPGSGDDLGATVRSSVTQAATTVRTDLGDPSAGGLAAVALPGGAGLLAPAQLPPDLPTPALPAPTLPAAPRSAAGWQAVAGELRCAVVRLGQHLPADHVPAGLPDLVGVPVRTATATPGSAPVQAAAPFAGRLRSAGGLAPVQALAPSVRSGDPRAPAPGPVAPALPGAPGIPLSPLTAPVTPGGVGGAQGTGGLSLVDQAGLPVAPALAAALACPAAAPLGRAAAGKQPGSTPD